MKIICLRNKTPKVRAILKLIGICLYHLYGYVAKWVRGRGGDSQTIHMLSLYNVILHSVACKGWAFQAADSCLRKGMAVGISLWGELLVLCVRFGVMVNYWTRKTVGWNSSTVAGCDYETFDRALGEIHTVPSLCFAWAKGWTWR